VDFKCNPDGRPYYIVQGATAPIPFERMLHITLMGDGLRGQSPIRAGQQAISAGLMQDQFASSFYANGTRAGGILKYAEQLSPEVRAELREQINLIHGGPDNAGKMMILDGG